MDFHHCYFKLGGQKQEPGALVNTTMASPHVRLLGDSVAIISYIRLIQRVGKDGAPHTKSVEETRVWQRQEGGGWKHVHFHRSIPAEANK